MVLTSYNCCQLPSKTLSSWSDVRSFYMLWIAEAHCLYSALACMYMYVAHLRSSSHGPSACTSSVATPTPPPAPRPPSILHTRARFSTLSVLDTRILILKFRFIVRQFPAGAHKCRILLALLVWHGKILMNG